MVHPRWDSNPQLAARPQDLSSNPVHPHSPCAYGLRRGLRRPGWENQPGYCVVWIRATGLQERNLGPDVISAVQTAAGRGERQKKLLGKTSRTKSYLKNLETGSLVAPAGAELLDSKDCTLKLRMRKRCAPPRRSAARMWEPATAIPFGPDPRTGEWLGARQGGAAAHKHAP